MSAYRVSAVICDENGRLARVSFIVESGTIPGWKWAVEQAHMHLAGQVVGEVSVDQIWPEQEG